MCLCGVADLIMAAVAKNTSCSLFLWFSSSLSSFLKSSSFSFCPGLHRAVYGTGWFLPHDCDDCSVMILCFCALFVHEGSWGTHLLCWLPPHLQLIWSFDRPLKQPAPASTRGKLRASLIISVLAIDRVIPFVLGHHRSEEHFLGFGLALCSLASPLIARALCKYFVNKL